MRKASGLREPVYSLDHWLLMKGDNSGADTWKTCIGQGTEKGWPGGTNGKRPFYQYRRHKR